MPTLSSNMDAILALCGYPDTQKYPNLLGTMARGINQVARMMMREARLSDQNQYLNFQSLPSPQKETVIPFITDPNSICTVELVSDSTEDSRTDIPIVGRMELNAREELGFYCCARFGSPTRLRFTWNPADAGDTLYVGYEVLPVDSEQPSDVPNLPESFHDCLQYREAAILKETVLSQECTPVFLDMMGKMEKQWSQWCRRDSEERPVQRPGFGSIDYDDPMGSWY